MGQECNCKGAHAYDCTFFDPFVDGTLLDVDEAIAAQEKSAMSDPIIQAILGLAPKEKESESWVPGQWVKKCSHVMDEFKFSDDSVVYASSLTDSWHVDSNPDFAVYLDRAWDEGQAYALFPFWPDYGVPGDDFEEMHKVLVSILLHARAGLTVEVGCIGAHGRTGTLLALLEVLASEGNTEGKDAIKKVRAEHCEHAIETRDQEWYVKAYRAWLLGLRMPTRPSKKRFQPMPTIEVAKSDDKNEKKKGA